MKNRLPRKIKKHIRQELQKAGLTLDGRFVSVRRDRMGLKHLEILNKANGSIKIYGGLETLSGNFTFKTP